VHQLGSAQGRCVDGGIESNGWRCRAGKGLFLGGSRTREQEIATAVPCKTNHARLNGGWLLVESCPCRIKVGNRRLNVRKDASGKEMSHEKCGQVKNHSELPTDAVRLEWTDSGASMWENRTSGIGKLLPPRTGRAATKETERLRKRRGGRGHRIVS